jgi:hypothetical protein
MWESRPVTVASVVGLRNGVVNLDGELAGDDRAVWGKSSRAILCTATAKLGLNTTFFSILRSYSQDAGPLQGTESVKPLTPDGVLGFAQEI